MVQFRRALASDAHFMEKTYRPFVEDGWASFEYVAPDEAEIRNRLKAAGDIYPWLIAEDSAPVAYAYASTHRSRQAYETSVDTTIYCAPSSRGKGIGTALYRMLLETLTRQNFVMAFAGIALPNDGSLALHEKLGFERIGTYPNVGYKAGQWRSTEWWAKPLADPATPPNPIYPVSEILDELFHNRT